MMIKLLSDLTQYGNTYLERRFLERYENVPHDEARKDLGEKMRVRVNNDCELRKIRISNAVYIAQLKKVDSESFELDE